MTAQSNCETQTGEICSPRTVFGRVTHRQAAFLTGAELGTVAEVAAEVYEACRRTRRADDTRGDVRLFVL